ncbi:MAG: hypothetical protein OM95_00515 [Bdellovibrio sp. ArHS]|uniref:hypothetical protein n=1 Tax=Bdellovibrio sp. ArHS TaxID=1569284 RepID=UPI0005832203|nr:hypothetical protein [Bdellovibrio sp. ArHS]KHD90037.1 MAG: hypothetical protein OM95_00515 [Bdellovibrio sp. ArHS]
MFNVIQASSQIRAEVEKLKIFLHLMFIEFCTQKWGKAAILAGITLLVAENKNWLLELANNNRFIFLFLFFVLYWLRFYLAELIPKSSAQETTLHHTNLKKIKEDTKIAVTLYEDAQMLGGGFRVHWSFVHRLRAIPLVILQSYTLSEQFRNRTPQLELKYEPHEGSKSKLEFSLHFNIAGFGGKSYQALTLEDVFDSLDLSVDARPFSPESFYGRTIHIFSVKAKQHKYLKILC